QEAGIRDDASALKSDGDLLRSEVPERKLLQTACRHDLEPSGCGKFLFSCNLSTTRGSFVNKRYVIRARAGTTTTTTTTTTAGDLFTNPNNIGNFETSSFSVVPQLEIKLGYDITRNLRATIGYDAMLWTNVERPGNQINHVIGSGSLNDRSTVFVNGVSAGLEFR